MTAGGRFAGVIQDGGLGGNAPTGLKLTGGELILCGNNSYSDGTVVSGGTLIAASASALPDGGRVTVGAGGTLIFDPSLAGGSIEGSSLAVSPGTAPATVPEPGTLALLAAAATLAATAACWRRKGTGA